MIQILECLHNCLFYNYVHAPINNFIVYIVLKCENMVRVSDIKKFNSLKLRDAMTLDS